MVSQLSARLFHPSDSQDNTPFRLTDTTTTPSLVTSNKAATAANGYSASIERLVKRIKAPPATIDLLSRKTKREMRIFQDSTGDKSSSNKRRKINELNYLAATAKKDLIRGGVHVPTVRVECPRTLSSQVDMSGVSLAYSHQDFDDSNPFLNAELVADNISFYNDIGSIVSMISACQHAYLPPSEVSSPTLQQPNIVEDTQHNTALDNDAESSTSSMTDPESEYHNNNAAVNDVSVQSNGTSGINAAPAFMVMGEALAFCKQPRLVTLSIAPYVIVHCNAAFTCLTGQSSVDVMGRPLSDIIKDESQSNSNNIKSLNDQVLQYNGVETRLSVTPVGISAENNTHYTVDLRGDVVQNSNNNNNSIRPMGARRMTKDAALVVA